jgi:uncharacterized protein (TIGR02284 family)
MPQNEMAQLLNSLLETLENAKLNFAEAASKVGSGKLGGLLAEYGDDCARALNALQKSVQSLGETAAVGASAGGVIRKGWIKLKSALSADAELAAIEEAEHEHTLVQAAFDKVLEAQPIDAVREVVERERQLLDRGAERLVRVRVGRGSGQV